MMRLIVSTTNTGYSPMAVSPLSITASAPSRTALATSVTSLRLGFVRFIMLSIICVATITGLARCMHLRISSFWRMGTCSTGNSTPRSPRAIMMPSLSTMMSRIFLIASGISILAITFILLFLSLILFFRSVMSTVRRTNERATQSSFCSMIKSRSARSFSVSEGMVSAESGRLTPFLGRRMPPAVTLTNISFSLSTSLTATSIFPSSMKMRSPTCRSFARCG